MTNYAVGHNMAGYLPEGDVYVTDSFEDAKRVLISDLKFAEEHAETDAEADDYCAAAEDVNLWNTPDAIYVNYRSSWMAYWIVETDEPVEDDES